MSKDNIITRKVPKKNYVFFTLMFIITVLLLWYLSIWYKTYKDLEFQTPVIQGYIGEIKITEFDNFLRDNQTIMIYVGVPNNNRCREFEEKLKKVVVDHNIGDKIVYLNLKDYVNENENYGKLLDEKYGAKNLRNAGKRFDTIPMIAYFKNGELYDIIIDRKSKKISIEKIEKFLETYEIIVLN